MESLRFPLEIEVETVWPHTSFVCWGQFCGQEGFDTDVSFVRRGSPAFLKQAFRPGASESATGHTTNEAADVEGHVASMNLLGERRWLLLSFARGITGETGERRKASR